MSSSPHKKLIQDLKKQHAKDQAMRKKWAQSNFDPSVFDSSIDEASREILEQILKKTGWPRQSEFGKETPKQVWVLTQHTDDLSLQKKILKQMKVTPRNEIDTSLIAKTEDRIRLREGKKQLYGTSFTIDLKTNSLSVDPIEDEEHINERRKKLGLDTFEEQKKRAFDSFKKPRSTTRHN